MSNLLIPSELLMEHILAAKVTAILLYEFPECSLHPQTSIMSHASG